MEFTIKLTEQQVNIVLQSLAKMPLEQVIEPFLEIKQQAEKQLQTEKQLQAEKQLQTEKTITS